MPVSRDEVDRIMDKIAGGDRPSADELKILEQAKSEEPVAETNE